MRKNTNSVKGEAVPTVDRTRLIVTPLRPLATFGI
jgi:hypothetical protein